MKKRSKKEIKRRIDKYGIKRICKKCGKIAYSQFSYPYVCLKCRGYK